MRRKIARVQKLRESTAFMTRKVQEFFNRHLVSLVSDLGTEQLRSQHFVKRSFHYQCLDLNYIAPIKELLPISKLIIYDIRLNLRSFKDLISLDASILKELEATVTILSAVSQKVTQVQYPKLGVCYVTHSSQPNFRPIIGPCVISIRY